MRRSVHLCLFVFLAATGTFAQTPITFQYFYDDLNQLVKVVDSTGIVIQYGYDSVGNIVQINRSTVASGALTIFNVAPQTVGSGATITIQGQGFSTTPSLNVVMIDGIPATVVSATSTALVVLVPVNGMTGSISVTVGGQTVTTNFNETVVPTPVIYSVRPHAAQAGTLVSALVTGVNLTGVSFSFSAAGLGASIATINSTGTSATLIVAAAPNANGPSALIATNSVGGSSGSSITRANAFGVFTDPNADPDNDGLLNGLEALLGTDPFDPDSDGDGFPDGVEVASGSDPLNPACTPLNCRVSGEEDGVVFSALNSILPVGTTAEADSTAFSLLNIHLPATFPSEAESTAFSLLNIHLPASLASESDSAPFSICNQQGSCADYSPLVPAARRPPVITTRLPPSQTGSKLSTDPGASATTPFVVGSVTPANRVTEIALDSVVALVFSTPLDPASINVQNFQLWAERKEPTARLQRELLHSELRYSSDFRTVMLRASLPANARVDVRASTSVQDIWGRHLEDFQSEFGTTDSSREVPPFVLGQKPPMGSNAVAADTKIELFLGRMLDSRRSAPALQVTQDGEPVQGEAHLSTDRTHIQFVPVQPFRKGVNVRVHVSDVPDQLGRSAVTYEGTFRTVEEPDNLVEPARATPGSSVEVPINSVIEVEYTRPLAAASVDIGSVTLREISTSRPVAASVSLRNDRVIRIQPAEPLAANSGYAIEISGGLRDASGQPAASFDQTFLTSAYSPTTGLQASFLEPKEGAIVGERSEFRVAFGGPVNPLTLDERTVRVTVDGRGVPIAITLVAGAAEVILTPLRVLEGSALVNILVSGVEDPQGNPVPPATGGFRVQPNPDALVDERRKVARAIVGQTFRKVAWVLYGRR